MSDFNHIAYLEDADLFDNSENIDEMAEFLTENGAKEAAKLTAELSLKIKKALLWVEAYRSQLYPIWDAARRLEDYKCNKEQFDKCNKEWLENDDPSK